MTSDYNYGTQSANRNSSNQYYAAYRESNAEVADIKRKNNRMSEASGVSYLANHLMQTASFDYDHDEENNENINNGNVRFSSSNSKTSARELEDNYSRTMSRMNRGDFDPNRKKLSGGEKGLDHRSSRGSANSGRSKMENQSRHSSISGNTNTNSNLVENSRPSHRRESESTARTRLSKTKIDPAVNRTTKKTVSNKDPSEETIAIFGANGVTGHHFLQRAMEAGYKIQALISPGMPMEDVADNKNIRLVTGSLEEIGKIREVVENASYVVCLLNDCVDEENIKPPIGNMEDEAESDSYFNLNFVHNLVPILEKSETCRVLLYETSSMALDDKGSAPFLTKMAKKMAFRKNWRSTKREQDRIVQYIANKTKDAPFNYIITRPSAALIWDRSSRKKLAASKSQPGPFPITNIDLAEFTLSALQMGKIYNSCPYVVQDGI